MLHSTEGYLFTRCPIEKLETTHIIFSVELTDQKRRTNQMVTNLRPAAYCERRMAVSSTILIARKFLVDIYYEMLSSRYFVRLFVVKLE